MSKKDWKQIKKRVNKKDPKDRAGDMLEMYIKENMSLTDIGEEYDLSRERIRQLIGYTPEYKEHGPNHKRAPRYDYICDNPKCGKIMKLTPSELKYAKSHNKRCSSECAKEHKDHLRYMKHHVGTKECTKCHKEKPVEEFFTHMGRKDVYQDKGRPALKMAHCKDCHRKMVKRWKEQNPKRAKEINKKAVERYRKKNRKKYNRIYRKYYRERKNG